MYFLKHLKPIPLNIFPWLLKYRESIIIINRIYKKSNNKCQNGPTYYTCNKYQYILHLSSFYIIYYFAATASISTRAPIGRAATSKQMRAGISEVKNSA